MNKLKAMKIAEETMNILESGEYTNRHKKTVNITAALNESVRSAILYSPAETDRLLNLYVRPVNYNTKIEVTSESTIAAIRRLCADDGKVCALNFASARNPGGGFLNGARAQEESIARSSGLYPTIAQMTEMYEHNLRIRSGFYSDYMIFSPNVPVFRDDMGNLLDQPNLVSMITAPAVNAGIVREREPQNGGKINQVMRRRIEKILAVAVTNQQEVIILGAFGCGVFKNKPEDVASIFQDVLYGDRFKGAFKKVVFAVFDPTPQKVSFNTFSRFFK